MEQRNRKNTRESFLDPWQELCAYRAAKKCLRIPGGKVMRSVDYNIVRLQDQVRRQDRPGQ